MRSGFVASRKVTHLCFVAKVLFFLTMKQELEQAARVELVEVKDDYDPRVKVANAMREKLIDAANLAHKLGGIPKQLINLLILFMSPETNILRENSWVVLATAKRQEPLSFGLALKEGFT